MYNEEGQVKVVKLGILEGTLVKVNGRLVEVYYNEQNHLAYNRSNNPNKEEALRLQIGAQGENWVDGVRFAKEGLEGAFYDELEGRGKKVYYWSIKGNQQPIAVKTKALGRGIYLTTMSMLSEEIEQVRHIQVIHGLFVANQRNIKQINNTMARRINKFIKK